MIAIEAIETNYVKHGNKSIQLQGINLKIEQQDSIAIIGKTHSGKTTLLRCIACIDPINAYGAIKYDEFSHVLLANSAARSNDNLSANLAAKNISYIDQTKSLLESKTVFENIATPLLLARLYSKKEVVKQTEAILKFLDLTKLANSYPATLSPLEKILTCLGRAIIDHPKLLICDEPTIGLDQKSSNIITKKLCKIKAKFQVAIILATNDLELIKSVCDKVVVLDKGEIVEKTTVSQFFLQPTSNIGKEFIQLKARSELPLAIKKKLHKRSEDFSILKDDEAAVAIVRCSVYEAQNFELIFGKLIEKFNVTINIVSAYQEKIKKEEEVKLILLELTTTNARLQEILLMLNSHGIYSEVLGYVK